MKNDPAKKSIALKHVKKVMLHEEKYRSRKFRTAFLVSLSLLATALAILNVITIQDQFSRVCWSLAAALFLCTAVKQFMIKGFVELIDEEYEKKSNQRLEPTRDNAG